MPVVNGTHIVGERLKTLFNIDLKKLLNVDVCVVHYVQMDQ